MWLLQRAEIVGRAHPRERVLLCLRAVRIAAILLLEAKMRLYRYRVMRKAKESFNIMKELFFRKPDSAWKHLLCGFGIAAFIQCTIGLSGQAAMSGVVFVAAGWEMFGEWKTRNSKPPGHVWWARLFDIPSWIAGGAIWVITHGMIKNV